MILKRTTSLLRSVLGQLLWDSFLGAIIATGITWVWLERTDVSFLWLFAGLYSATGAIMSLLIMLEAIKDWILVAFNSWRLRIPFETMEMAILKWHVHTQKDFYKWKNYDVFAYIRLNESDPDNIL
jgi:hypothetical protein